MNKILKKNGDIYNSCPYINNLIDNIDTMKDSLIENLINDSTKQLEFIRAINQELRDKNEGLRVDDLKQYIHDVELELGTTTKENTMKAIKDLHDEIEDLKDKIEELKGEMNIYLNIINYLKDLTQ